MDDSQMMGRFEGVNSEENEHLEGLFSEQPLDPIALDIEDDELVRIINKRIKDSRNFYREEYDLYERRKKNEEYYFGRQIPNLEKEKLLKDYESRYQDNVLYEIEATIKPLAMSRLPDLLVTPGNDSDESKVIAQEITKVIDTQLKSRENRYVLGIAFKHLPVYFTGVIKCLWDPQIDDYRFEVIHPDMIDVDYTCPTKNADDMEFIPQIVPMTVEECLMRFPDKKEEFMEQLAKDGIKAGSEGEYSWSQLATPLKVREVWFTWYKKHEKKEWERIEGVLWKYKDVIFKKIKNPNFDYEGETKYFSYDEVTGEKTEVPPDAMLGFSMMGIMPPNIQEEKVFHNYFPTPRKPFYFLGYDQWGKQPLDETSRIEQNLLNQKALDKRGRQIEETLNNRGHHIWSKESGLKASQIEELDMNDPNEDVVVDGIPSNVHEFIPPERPTAQEFQDLGNTRDRMYGIAGASAVRGDIQTDVATSNQIGREADFTRADDLVEDTINAASEWMAGWSLQMIKLRYTSDHFKQVLGKAGEVVKIKLDRNKVDDGMVIIMKASGTDKLKASNNAIEMAKLKLIDPLTFFEDMGLADPEGRTEKLTMFMTNPQMYQAKYILNLQTPEEIAAWLATQPAPVPNPMMAPPPNPMMGQPPMPGMPPAPQPQMAPPPQAPMPGNTAEIAAAPPVGAPQGSPRVL